MIKFFCKRKQKGQSTLEYAILIIIIAAALLSIQAYIKRGIQSRLKEATDDISSSQYSVGNTNLNKITTKNTTTKEQFTDGVSTTTTAKEDSTEKVDASITNTEKEYWGGK